MTCVAGCCQSRHSTECQARCLRIQREFDVDLQLIINQRFQDCMNELRKYAGSQTAAFTSPIMRLLQIEERLELRQASTKIFQVTDVETACWGGQS